MSMELEINKTVEFEGKLYDVKIKKGLKTLKLYNLGIKDIADIKGLDNLTDLQVLNLAGNQITEIKGLENLRSLKRLLLYSNEITEIKGLENLTELEYLTLWKNPVFNETKDMFGGTGVNDQYKDPQAVVNYCQLTPEQREAKLNAVKYEGNLYKVSIKKGLKSLKLYNLGIKDIADIKGLDNLTDLQVLNLAGNQITEIKGLENLRSLKRLLLYSNEITAIKGLENLTKLEYLTLWKNPVFNETKDIFGGTGVNDQYKDPQAVVNYCQLTPEQRDAKRVEAELMVVGKNAVEFEGNLYKVSIKKGLKTLKLYNLGIKDISDIKGLDNLTDLQVLNLAGNQIIEIKGLENLRSLKKLLLYSNEITAIKGVENLTKLEYLTLWKNPVFNETKDIFGGTGVNDQYKDPQAVVDYCRFTPEQREANRLEAERVEAERVEAERVEAERVEAERVEAELMVVGKNAVEYEGNLYKVSIKKGLKTLKLYNLGIKDIADIKGLDNLTDLQVLNLAGNQITEIKGLENLRSLKRLLLYSNEITEIKGLENLTKLEYLTLWKNPVFNETKGMFGGTGINDQYKDPQTVIKYCQKAPKREEKARKEREQREREQRERGVREAEQRERERRNRKKKEKKVKIEAIKSIKKLSIIYKEIKIDKISSKIGLDLEYIENLIEEMIINKEIEAEINENSLIFKKSTPESKEEKKISLPPKEFNEKTIKILRGGDWKIEGNQSVFYYKVKVENNSQFLIGNIQILLTSIPQGLKTQSQVYTIDFLKPGSFESPTFKLNATESCVGDTLEGLVSYTDPRGTQQTVNVEPFKISYVCNLLTPKLITKEEFEEKIGFMVEKKLIIDSNVNITDLEQILERKIKQCNFALLKQIKNSQREGFRKIEGFAQGLYDKEDVGISVAVKKMEEGSKLVIKAMSDRGEKVTELLKDFSIRLDDIKNDTELIKEYTSQIEEIFDKQVDLEAYLKSHLGSGWEKIKDSWQDYKTGKIDKKELIYRGIKSLGRSFIRNITRFI